MLEWKDREDRLNTRPEWMAVDDNRLTVKISLKKCDYNVSCQIVLISVFQNNLCEVPETIHLH